MTVYRTPDHIDHAFKANLTVARDLIRNNDDYSTAAHFVKRALRFVNALPASEYKADQTRRAFRLLNIVRAKAKRQEREAREREFDVMATLMSRAVDAAL